MHPDYNADNSDYAKAGRENEPEVPEPKEEPMAGKGVIGVLATMGKQCHHWAKDSLCRREQGNDFKTRLLCQECSVLKQVQADIMVLVPEKEILTECYNHLRYSTGRNNGIDECRQRLEGKDGNDEI